MALALASEMDRRMGRGGVGVNKPTEWNMMGGTTSSVRRSALDLVGYLVLTTIAMRGGVHAYTMVPRWGHAAAYLPSPPTLVIQGGKTDNSSTYSYTSAPNSGNLIVLSLASSFSTSSPPWVLIETTTAPTYAWHTLSLLALAGSNWTLLIFGGDGGTSLAIETGTDSSWLLSIDSGSGSGDNATFTQEASSWASQPMRRIHHSAVTGSNGGSVYITGGLKDDGSGQAFADVLVFDPIANTFSTLPSLPQALYHHVSIFLNNGTIVVLGGVYASGGTGTPTVLSPTTIYVLDTTSSSPGWDTITIGGTSPAGRRGATATLSQDGGTIFVFGGADAGLTTVYDDGWLLNVNNLGWTQVANGGTGPVGRYDHTAVPAGGGQVVVFGGYGSSAPADDGTYVYDSNSNTWASSYSPTSTSASGTAAATSGSGASQTGTAVKSASAGSVTTASGSGTKSSLTRSGASTSNPTASSPANPNSNDGQMSLSTSAKIGLALGILALVCAIIAGVIFLCRRNRRKKQRRLAAARAWQRERRSTAEARGGSGGPGGPMRPYGSREKAGPGLMDPGADDVGEKALPQRPAAGAAAAGVGVIGAGLATLTRLRNAALGGRSERGRDPYAPIAGESDPLVVPKRTSTRREGTGIRLVGPRGPRPPPGVVAALVNQRHDLLNDEDSRTFGIVPAGRPIARGTGPWRSASDILRHPRGYSDPFSDDEDEPLPPPIRGGPVPTPHASRSELDPFDDYASSGELHGAIAVSGTESGHSSGQASSGDTFGAAASRSDHGLYRLPSLHSDPLDLNLNLFPDPPTSTDRFSGISLPGSEGLGSESEEGTIHQATIASAQPASLVPPPQAYSPVKRSESFFRRMGLSGLLSSQTSRRDSVRSTTTLDIRDPAPAPTLWPIRSRDELSELAYPPSSWKPGVSPTEEGSAHPKGPSLSSTNSARSMRDMVIVQREPTDTSECTDPLLSTEGEIGEMSRSPSMDMMTPSHSIPSLHESVESAPGTVVFDGAALLATPRLPDIDEVSSGSHPADSWHSDAHSSAPGPGSGGEASRSRASSSSHSPSHSNTKPARTNTLSAWTDPDQSPSESGRSSPSTPPRTTGPTVPPSGSPLPPSLVAHRRPVREMVSSINKRGGPLPTGLASPARLSPSLGSGSRLPEPDTPGSGKSGRSGRSGKSGASGDSGASGNSARSGQSGASGASGASGLSKRKTVYESVKRGTLVVANPDERGRSSSG